MDTCPGSTQTPWICMKFGGPPVGYFHCPGFTKWLMALGAAIDVLTIWVLILLTIGCAEGAGVTTSSAAVGVWGWWILITLVKMGHQRSSNLNLLIEGRRAASSG